MGIGVVLTVDIEMNAREKNNMRSEKEIRAYMRELKINRRLAFLRDEMYIVRGCDKQTNLLKWVLEEDKCVHQKR